MKPHPLPPITEKDLLTQVIKVASMYDWSIYHTWNSQHSTAGFPDLVLVRPPTIIFAELKNAKRKLSPHQEVWIKMLRECPGVKTFVWRPADLQDIADTLAHRAEVATEIVIRERET